MDALLWTNKEADVVADEQEDSGTGFQPSRYSPPNGRNSICLGREDPQRTDMGLGKRAAQIVYPTQSNGL